MEIIVNYHSSIIIDKTIFVDPLMVTKGSAKYIFITHPHYDHFSPDDIKKIITDETTIICPATMQGEVAKHFANKVLPVLPSKSYDLGDIKFETIPAYNTTKHFHPRQNNWVGYILELDGARVTITGDTDATPELMALKTDVLLLPIGGTFTMDFKEAADLANHIKPKKVIPIHYGAIVGDKNLGGEFQKLLDSGIECEIQLG